jgi:Na+/H+ antiporter NhaC
MTFGNLLKRIMPTRTGKVICGCLFVLAVLGGHFSLNSEKYDWYPFYWLIYLSILLNCIAGYLHICMTKGMSADEFQAYCTKAEVARKIRNQQLL